MKKILFDHQIFSMQRYGGISRYFANIYQSLNTYSDFKAEIAIVNSPNYYLKDYPGLLNNPVGQFLLKKQNRAAKWNKIYSKYKIQKGGYDILHPTYYNPYFLKYTKKPFVITVHDMIHELFPEYFDTNDIFIKYKRLCVENAAHIIAISESTKKDLQDILRIEEQRITVVHHGFNEILSASYQNINLEVKNKDYILYVGDRRGYKNFFRFATSMAPILNKYPELRLICAGGGAFGSAESEMLRRLKIDNNVTQMNASDQQLSDLYRNALAFVYPSVYEGFGLPILEAFQNNCVVLASNHACFREVGADAIAYFNPYDINSMTGIIESTLHDSERRKIFIQNGREQLLKFPLSKCMSETIDVYKKINA